HSAVLALVLAIWAPLSPAQPAYPAKPIHMIVPLAAGSAVDNAMRIVTERMSTNLGQGIVIENQPGAAGLIGAERVAKAAPDGYTIGGFNDSIMTMLPNLYAKLSWDILKDFELVSLVATVEWGLVASSASPYRSADAAAPHPHGTRRAAQRGARRGGGCARRPRDVPRPGAHAARRDVRRTAPAPPRAARRVPRAKQAGEN